MNPKTLARQFDKLQPGERFALILSAMERNDDTEAERLKSSSARIGLTMYDFGPHSQAFQQIGLLFFCEVLEEASDYLDLLQFNFGTSTQSVEVANTTEDEEQDKNRKIASEMRQFDAALVTGFWLKLKVAGWQVFCERLGVPPFSLWRELPGWARVEHARKSAEQLAFDPHGMLMWLNSIRPAGKQELKHWSLTPELLADSISNLFRQEMTRLSGK